MERSSRCDGRLDHAQVQLSYGPRGSSTASMNSPTLSLSSATAYLHGVAGMCAFSMQSTIDVIGYTARGRAPTTAARDAPPRRRRLPGDTPAATVEPFGGLDEMDNETMHNALRHADAIGWL